MLYSLHRETIGYNGAKLPSQRDCCVHECCLTPSTWCCSYEKHKTAVGPATVCSICLTPLPALCGVCSASSPQDSNSLQVGTYLCVCSVSSPDTAPATLYRWVHICDVCSVSSPDTATATLYRWVHICDVCSGSSPDTATAIFYRWVHICDVCSVSSPDTATAIFYRWVHICDVVCHHLTQQQLFSTGGYTSVMCVVCHHIKQQQPNFTGGCGSLPVQLSSVQGGSSYMLRKTHTLHPS